jgi:hypothetical protein
MKKILMAAAVALFATSVYAEDCTVNGQKASCFWDKSICWGINTDYGGSKDASCCGSKASASDCNFSYSRECSCAELLDNCRTNGTLYASSDYGAGETSCAGTVAGGRDPNASQLGCCRWETEGGKCWPIWEGKDSDGEEGTDKVASCKTGGNAFWNTSCPADGGQGGCPSGTPLYDGEGADNCGYSCKWPDSDEPNTCQRVTPDPSGKYGDPTASCDEAVEACRSWGNLYNGSACAGNPINGGNNPPINPIVKIPGQVSGNALIAMQNAINLQLTGDATLRIYDMKGKVVRAQKVERGNNVVQLQLPRGLYIAKATSGSWKQTVKVTVK